MTSAPRGEVSRLNRQVLPNRGCHECTDKTKCFLPCFDFMYASVLLNILLAVNIRTPIRWKTLINFTLFSVFQSIIRHFIESWYLIVVKYVIFFLTRSSGSRKRFALQFLKTLTPTRTFLLFAYLISYPPPLQPLPFFPHFPQHLINILKVVPAIGAQPSTFSLSESTKNYANIRW